MSVLDIFALVVIAILIAVVIWLVVLLGSMPGNIAKKRGHPQADAIRALGWIGIITMGVGWLIAIVWAYTKPVGSQFGDRGLEDRVKTLEARIEQLQGAEGES
jgi:hypothetical protein